MIISFFVCLISFCIGFVSILILFVSFSFFLALASEKNVKEMIVKSMSRLVSALPVDQINISRG